MNLFKQISLFDRSKEPALIERALIVREPWASKIVSGKKILEIRGSNTNIREPIGIIAGGTGKIIGVCELVGVRGPLSLEEYIETYSLGGGVDPQYLNRTQTLPYKQTFAWELKNPQRLSEPIRYEHPNGAVIWVKLKKNTQEALHKALSK
ncbi:ASCH domain-containing protein [Bacillus chungangensis]|uniref:ASCH domain-containing protein n=1 Tax=Bacillus chungangensis TaxID=587633 RepID=A0ABT9WN17_9BACI|nr:ASCH domain-containing protein [Bacillus chungangensis]MDQ0174684.1 hypothetical protein [Bacillus chungangensis]